LEKQTGDRCGTSRAIIDRACFELGEVDVVRQASLPSALDQSKQSSPLGRSRSTPDYDDDPRMRLFRCEFQKIVTVASQEHTTTLMRQPEHGFIGRIMWKGLAQESDLVTELFEQIA
jgi:hypothetical protein